MATTNRSFSLSRMLANADTFNAPEFETHFKLLKGDSFKEKYALGSSAVRPGSSELLIPWSALLSKKRQQKLAKRDLQTTTQSQGAFTIGTDVAGGIQQSLRPTSLLMKLPITVLSGLQGSTVFPRISTGNAPSNATEIANISSPDLAFGASNAGPQRLSANIVFSRQLLNQSADQIDAVLANELCRAISYQIDSQILTGSGVNAQALGVLNQTATSTATFVAANAWGQLMQMQQTLETNAIDSDNAYYLINPNTARVWRTLLRSSSTARYVLDQKDSVGDIKAYPTVFIGSSDQVVLADWSQLVLGIFGQGVSLTYDPFTKASTGEIVLTIDIFYNSFIRRPQAFVVSSNAGSIFTS
jgi:HK97 family phage major capsid protein